MEKLSNVITVFYVIAMVCTSDMVEGGRGAKKFMNEKVADQTHNISPGPDPVPVFPFFPCYQCFPLVPPVAKAKALAPPVQQPSAVTSSTVVHTSSMGYPPSRTFPAVQMHHVVKPPSPKTTSKAEGRHIFVEPLCSKDADCKEWSPTCLHPPSHCVEDPYYGHICDCI